MLKHDSNRTPTPIDWAVMLAIAATATGSLVAGVSALMSFVTTAELPVWRAIAWAIVVLLFPAAARVASMLLKNDGRGYLLNIFVALTVPLVLLELFGLAMNSASQLLILLALAIAALLTETLTAALLARLEQLPPIHFKARRQRASSIKGTAEVI